MNLFVCDNNINKFIQELYNFIQEKLADDFPVIYSKTDYIYIGHKNFYIYIYDEFGWEHLREEYDINININIDINVYNKLYEQAVDDISRIINWLIDRNKEDFLLFDDQSVPILYRKKGEVIVNKGYMYFPLKKIITQN